MAESHIVSGLTKKRVELLGKIEAYQKEIQRISEMLLHVDHTIKLKCEPLQIIRKVA